MSRAPQQLIPSTRTDVSHKLTQVHRVFYIFYSASISDSDSDSVSVSVSVSVTDI